MGKALENTSIQWDAPTGAALHPGIAPLRRALRANLISFPSQIPPLLKQPRDGMQWRMVLLFFVRGWRPSRIAARYGVPSHQVWRILNGWAVRAMIDGYVQVIDPEGFAACCRVSPESLLDLGGASQTSRLRIVSATTVEAEETSYALA